MSYSRFRRLVTGLSLQSRFVLALNAEQEHANTVGEIIEDPEEAERFVLGLWGGAS